MLLEGSLTGRGGVALLGSYPAPPGPDWGWRITLEPGEAGTWSCACSTSRRRAKRCLAWRRIHTGNKRLPVGCKSGYTEEMNPTIDRSFLTQTLVELVRIDFTNPSLSPSGAGEAEVGEYIARVMRDCGLQVDSHPLGERRVNVVGASRGSGGGRSLMWNAHMDTVGVEGMQAPFSPEVRNGRLYGRGAQDMKGSLAAMLAAARALHDAGIELKGDLLLTCVADEEFNSLGTEHLLRHYRADGAIVTEPTGLDLALAHRGYAIFDVETTGRAAHGSRYQEGIDAILHMGRFLARLDRLEKALLQRIPHPLVGPPSLHASTIHGGSEMSTYPSRCHLMLERRTIPGETPEQITSELQAMLDDLAEADPLFRGSLAMKAHRSPLEIDPEAPLVKAVEAAMQRRLGRAPRKIGAGFWTDAALLVEAGIPALVVGPTGGGLHTDEEWVDLQSVEDLAGVLAEAAIEFSG